MHYSILDFNAVMKHCYYSQSNSQGEKIFCEQTEKYFPSWKSAAATFIDRYYDYILEQSNPRNIIACHDKGTDYRSKIYEGYKARRKEKVYSPVEVEQQNTFRNWLKSFLASVGATQIGFEGVEADDIIAWLCSKLEGTKSVYTVDADLLQLCSIEGVAVYLKLEAHYGDGEYKGIPYKYTSVAKSLLGDTSDEYAGVRGFGPKKLEQMLEAYGEACLKELTEIAVKSDRRKLLEAVNSNPNDKALDLIAQNFEEWIKMFTIASLHPELCENPKNPKIVHKRVPDRAKFEKLLTDAHLDDLVSTYEATLSKEFLVDSTNIETLKDTIYAGLKESDVVAFDYETTDKTKIQSFREASTQGDGFVDVLSQELTGASFCFGKYLQYTIYITVDHADSNNVDKSVVKDLLTFCQQNNIQLVAHNAFFEGLVTKKSFDLTLHDVRDTRIFQRYVNENDEAGLKFLSKHYLDYQQTSYTETVGDKSGMNELTAKEVFKYGVDDALVTAHLYDLLTLLLKLDDQYDFVTRWATNPTMVLQHSYEHGVNINWKLQERIHKRDIDAVEEGMKELRSILLENVTGMKTLGCDSFIEAELPYMRKAFTAKYAKDEVSQKLYEWRRKLEDSCQYKEFFIEETAVEVPFTATNLTKTSKLLGLPDVEKHTLKFLREYLETTQFHCLTDDGSDKYKFLSLIDNFLKTKETEPMIEFMKDKLQLKPKVKTYGDELNVGSPVQMQQLVYCKIGVPVRIKGKNPGKARKEAGFQEGAPSTDEIAINTALANDVQKGSWQESALNTLLKVKSANTRISLYHEKYPLWKHLDGKIHPYFTDAGTDTRRPTGGSPNVLQVSKKDKSMREMFVPPSKDHVVVAIDYNGQELRILACQANDPVMIDAYNSPNGEKDLHSVTGAGIAKLKAANSGDKNYAELSDFTKFDDARSNSSHELNKLASFVRKMAKGCIAAGSPVLTDKGLVPIDFVTTEHKVWDGVEFVSHDGVEYKGEKEVISFGGLTATVDHDVFLDDGRTVQFGAYAAQQDGKELAIGELNGLPVRYFGSEVKQRSTVVNTQTSSVRVSKVYDIINAGPLHRFTVSGVIVHNCNFGLAFGAGASTLSRNLIVPLNEARELLEGTMTLYKRVPMWQEETADFMKKKGYTLTAFGTKRHATSELYRGSDDMKARQCRQGTNATIQGTAAEMLRIVLTGIIERDLLNKLNMVFFAPIYDETVAFVHKDDVYEYCKNMHELMQGATPPSHAVIQQPEISIGATWGTVHECGRFNELGESGIKKYVDLALAEAEVIWSTDLS